MDTLLMISLNITFPDVLMVLGVIFLSAAIAMEFANSSSGLATGYLGLWMLWKSHRVVLGTGELLFWAVVVILLYIISRMQQKRVFPPLCRRFVLLGALAGMAVGLVGSTTAWVTGGAIVGALLGVVAWSRTPSGRVAGVRLTDVATRVGLPAVTVTSMTGLALASFLSTLHHAS